MDTSVGRQSTGLWCEVVRRVSAAAALVVLLVAPAAAENMVVNGDFTRGSGNAPTEWRTDKWDTAPDATDFIWIGPEKGEPGQASIHNKKPNDSRFVQDLRVKEQTWYHISGKIRTEGVGQAAIGAYVSLMEGFQNTEDVKGTKDWQPVEMWVKTEKWQDRLELALITGGLWYYLRPPRVPEDRGTPQEKLALAALLIGVFAVKVAVAPHFGFDTDLGTYKAWALRLAEVGPADFYAPNYFCDYPPGYLYLLWIVG